MHQQTFAVIVILFLGTYAVLAQPICKDTDPKVLIIGAGVSGIAAARTLYDKGIKDFVILEATAKVGGRIRSSDFAGVKVELGSSIIVGVDGTNSPRLKTNPIWALKQATNFNATLSNYSSYIAFNDSGATVTSDVDLAFERYDAAYKNATSILQARGDAADISVRDGLNKSGWYPSNPPDYYVDWYNCDWAYGITPEEGSLRAGLEDTSHADFGASSYIATDARGMEYLVRYLGEPFLNTKSLHLNTTVASIEYGTQCACANANENGQMVRYCAKQAIVSLNVGVLQTGKVAFTPALPQWKVDAINQFSYRLYLQIYVLFNETFWDTSVYVIGHASTNRGNFPMFYPVGKYFPSKPHLLMTFATGSLATTIANQDSSTTKQQIYAVLRSMYGNFRSQIVDILIPDILSYNQFGLHATIAPKVGATSATFDKMSAPVGSLLFAGDATDLHYNGYAHGAYLSGVRVAEQVLLSGASGPGDLKYGVVLLLAALATSCLY